MREMYVDAPHFYAGLIIDENGYVSEAAPILRWTIGKREEYLIQYFNGKKWKYGLLPERNANSDTGPRTAEISVRSVYGCADGQQPGNVSND